MAVLCPLGRGMGMVSPGGRRTRAGALGVGARRNDHACRRVGARATRTAPRSPTASSEEARHDPRPALLDNHTVRKTMVDALIVSRTAASGSLDWDNRWRMWLVEPYPLTTARAGPRRLSEYNSARGPRAVCVPSGRATVSGAIGNDDGRGRRRSPAPEAYSVHRGAPTARSGRHTLHEDDRCNGIVRLAAIVFMSRRTTPPASWLQRDNRTSGRCCTARHARPSAERAAAPPSRIWHDKRGTTGMLCLLPFRKPGPPCAEFSLPLFLQLLFGFRRGRASALRGAPELYGQLDRRGDPCECRGQVVLAHEPRQLRELRDVVEPEVRVVFGRAREEVSGESCDTVREMGRGWGGLGRHARAEHEEQRGGSELRERRREPAQRFSRVAVEPCSRERAYCSDIVEPFDGSDLVRREKKPGDGRESLSARVAGRVGDNEKRRRSVPMMRL
jgi:hypothetical protein